LEFELISHPKRKEGNKEIQIDWNSDINHGTKEKTVSEHI
jgi:hypothetical protein